MARFPLFYRIGLTLRLLLTAFEPYGEWQENSSWLALVELLKNRPTGIDLVTRRYPVNLAGLREQLTKDLATGFDTVIHLGQSPGSSHIKLEAIALNLAGRMENDGDAFPPIERDGPLAFQSTLPLDRWANLLRSEKIPAAISYHAGTFLCNAVLYMTHFWYHHHQLPCNAAFLHLPLATEQIASRSRPTASLPVQQLAKALSLVLRSFA